MTILSSFTFLTGFTSSPSLTTSDQAVSLSNPLILRVARTQVCKASGLARMSHKFEKRCEVWQSEIRAGSVLAYVTKRIAAITPPRALVVLRFLLNNPQRTVCFWPNYTILFHTYTYIRSAETGEIFGLEAGQNRLTANLLDKKGEFPTGALYARVTRLPPAMRIFIN